MPDREKVIKKFADYVYYFKAYCTSDAYDHEMLKAVLDLLKEQENCENCAIAIEDRQPIVRCKDCKHGRRMKTENGIEVYCENNRIERIFCEQDWFCADGRKNDD